MSGLYKALLKAQSQMGAIKKDEKNPFFKSSFASLNAVRAAVMPSLTDNGIVLTQPTVVVDGKQYVETRLTHADTGEAAVSVTEVITKNSGDAQQAGSGISYARRYGLMSMLCLAAEDDDGEASVGRLTKPFVAASAPASGGTATLGGETKKKVSFAKKPLVEATTTVEDDI